MGIADEIGNRLISSSYRNMINSPFLKMCGEYMKDWIEVINILDG